MKTTLVVIGLAALTVATVLIAVAAIGAALPKNHEVSRSVKLAVPVAKVYEVVSDVEAAPSWRKDIQRIEVLGFVGGRKRFREYGSAGNVTYEIVEDRQAERFVTRIVDDDLGYSGSWTYSFEPRSGGTLLTITERGEVSNVMFRFLSRFVFGHSTTIEKYLQALTRRMTAHETSRGLTSR